MSNKGSKDTVYEVVWCDKNYMYVWDYRLKGRDVYPIYLPNDVCVVFSFVLKKTKAVMVYRLKNPCNSYCSHCSNRNFGDANRWLKKKGFKPYGDKK
jgi:hypothetical protein